MANQNPNSTPGTMPMKGGAGAGVAPNAPAEQVEQLYTSADVEKAVSERLATLQQQATSANPRYGSQPAPHNPSMTNADQLSAIVDAAVTRSLAQQQQALGGGSGGYTIDSSGRPVFAERQRGQSDRGGPSRDSSLAHEGAVWKMTELDVQSLIREKGFQAAGHELRTKLKQDLRGAGRIRFAR